MIDRPPLLDQRHDVRQPGLGQNYAGSRFGHIGCGTDGDSHFRLAESRRVVDAIIRHACDVPCGLQVLHDDVLVLGVHLCEGRFVGVLRLTSEGRLPFHGLAGTSLGSRFVDPVPLAIIVTV